MPLYFNPTQDPKMIGLDKKLMSMLNLARQASGIPFIITSGVRTPEENKKAGGVENSAHLKGLACDIRCENDSNRFEIVYGALMAGFVRVGKGEGHVHLDIDPTKPQRVFFIE